MLSPVRVVVVTSRLDVGGTERHIARILPELKRRGIDVTLYLMERGGVLESGLLQQGVRIEGPRRVVPYFLRWPAATISLTLWLRRERLRASSIFFCRVLTFMAQSRRNLQDTAGAS